MGGFGIDRYINWFCRVSALDVRSCVEHSLVLPCVDSSLTLARVLGINLFCRVSALAKRSLVCRGLMYCHVSAQIVRCV